MTISYSGNFAKLLLRWKGSLWKTVWKELSVFLISYYVVRFLYQYACTEAQRMVFEHLITAFDTYTSRIPIMFLLGFYVQAVVKRWWEQFEWLSWPDDVMSLVCHIVQGNEPQDLCLRRAVARYLNLSAALAWREISIKVRKRFPSIDHVMTAGLMTADERQLFQDSEVNSRWFVPLEWTQSMMEQHCMENGVPAPIVSHFLSALFSYREGFRQLHCYDWVCIPLVYTQVAAIATYGYFILCLVGRQFYDRRSYRCTDEDIQKFDSGCVDYYIPIFTILEFFFYVGWFKVGQDLMRPFEEDDDDFELNYILDRNIQVSSALANTMKADVPIRNMTRTGWDKPELSVVPHTKLSARLRYHPPKLHAYLAVKNPQDVQLVEPFLMKSPKKAQKWRYF